jgi:hypothetical protein
MPGEQQHVAAIRHVLQGGGEGVPAGVAHHPTSAALRAQVRRHDADVADAVGPAELPAASIAEPVRQVIRSGGELEQREVLALSDPDPLEDGALLPFCRPAAPAIEDVVIVPHHQGRHGGQDRGEFRLTPQPAVAVEIVVRDRLRHRGREASRPTPPPGQSLPSGERRDLAPERVRIQLIATLQQQVKRIAGVPGRQMQPALVALLRCVPGVALLAAVAGGIGQAQRSARGRQVDRPALPPDPVFSAAVPIFERQ